MQRLGLSFRRSLPASTSRGLDFLGQTVPLRSATELHVSERSRDYSTQFPSASEQIFVQHTCARLRQQGPCARAAHAGSYGHIAVPVLRRDASHTAGVQVLARRVKAGLSSDQMACAFPIDRRAPARRRAVATCRLSSTVISQGALYRRSASGSFVSECPSGT